MEELVSVIIPFLNGSNWLAEAVESVVTQTFPHWELILFDDGSDAEHSLAAKRLCRQHPQKIRYAEHSGHINRGVSITRNEASKLARGKYLAFLDADDIWFPNKLEYQVEMFATHPQVQVVFGAFTVWQSWLSRANADEIYHLGAPQGYYPPGTLNKMLYPFFPGTTPAPSGIMIKKQVFERIGRFEPAFSGIYELYEDQAFLAKVFLHNHVFLSEQSHLLYRRRPGSMSSAAGNRQRYHTVRVFYFNWLQQYLSSHFIYDAELSNLIEDRKRASLIEIEAMRKITI